MEISDGNKFFAVALEHSTGKEVRQLCPAWPCPCSVPSPEHCPEPSFCFEKGERKKMCTLPRCRGEILFGQENHTITPYEFFSLSVFVCV